MNELRAVLRQGTQAAHQRLDARMSTLPLDRRPSYSRFLHAQAAALVPLEIALEQAGVVYLLPDWSWRTRRAALLADIRQLDGEAPPSPASEEQVVDWIDSPAAMLGATYVLEGSRLGGALLRKQVLAAEDPVIRLASRFLNHGNGENLWLTFNDTLKEAQLDEAARAVMVDSAVRSFALFETAAPPLPN
ncbi:biliverdin-producing heme oxygenase [Lichenicoccus sp.]|uniref:biliverdin-producing heme oxygenase n=1 Tax=Lichenicoccus sp. TaxID=2781899 RepID=UPI003D1392D9